MGNYLDQLNELEKRGGKKTVRMQRELRSMTELARAGYVIPGRSIGSGRSFSITTLGRQYLASALRDGPTPAWHTRPADELEAAIVEFKRALPGWWYSVCECQLSSDASCAPTPESPHHKLVAVDAQFDGGFHADLLQPATLADALRNVMQQALAAIEKAQS